MPKVMVLAVMVIACGDDGSPGGAGAGGGGPVGGEGGVGVGGDGGVGGVGVGANGGGGGACEPITEDASAIGLDCAGGGPCPEGYTCHDYNGVLLQQQCAILCEASCDCPAGSRCEQQSDKVARWLECQ